MTLDLRPTCAKCKKVMEPDEIRALGDGKFICKDCYEAKNPSKFNPFRKETQTKFEKPKIKPVEHTAVEPIASNDNFFMQKEYECTECGYSFKRDASKTVVQCPYCGKLNTLRQKVE